MWISISLYILWSFIRMNLVAPEGFQTCPKRKFSFGYAIRPSRSFVSGVFSSFIFNLKQSKFVLSPLLHFQKKTSSDSSLTTACSPLLPALRLLIRLLLFFLVCCDRFLLVVVGAEKKTIMSQPCWSQPRKTLCMLFL